MKTYPVKILLAITISAMAVSLRAQTSKIDRSLSIGVADTIAIAGTSIAVGDNTLLHDMRLTIEAVDSMGIPALDMGLVNVTGAGGGFRYLPHGTHFSDEGAIVRVAYDRTRIPDGFTEEDIRTFFFDEQSHRWMPLSRMGIDRDRQEVVSLTTHFTDFINGVITAPEQPETTGFTPTMMGNIEAASPTAGISLIAPPSANSQGTATLEYPFIMPPARNGMSPTLGLVYNSDAGDGLCGEGWTLPIPSITIDTRWGVPRYSARTESETYLMNGQMLAMQSGDSLYLAHRNPNIDRNSSGNRRFLPRTETDFSLIERIGTATNNYSWKVTAPDGTEYRYGEGNAKLTGTFTDATGDTYDVTAEWLLSSIVEPHGDYINYYYHTADEPALGSLTSHAIYLDTIKAGNAGESPHTIVTIHYRARGNDDMRTSSARYGFLSSSQQLVDSITVTFLGQPLRTYGLQYADGRFGKKLLTRVTHYDEDGHAASFQDFSYYDEIGSATSMVAPQSDAETIEGDNDGLGEGFIIPGLEEHPTLLGGASTSSKSVSLYAGVGPCNGSPWKDNTIGANYEYSDDKTHGLVTFTDINGDGLPDKVFRKSDGLWYRPMICLANGTMSLGDAVKLVTQVSSFSTVKSHSNNIGGRAVIGAYDITYQRGYDRHSTKSRTTEYMADVNGDGLPDLVSNGRVWFNHIDTSGETPVPTFTEGSHLSPNPIFFTTAPDQTVMVSPTATQLDSIAEDSPMQDIVRVWEAPKDGTVHIQGSVQLQDPPSGYDVGEYDHADGVRVAVEKGGATLWSRTIGRDDHSLYSPTNVSSVSVSRGDRIFFRVQSGADKRANGSFDQVSWSPVIQYTTGSGTALPDGGLRGVYPSTQGMTYGQGNMVPTGGMSSLTLAGRMVKPVTSDSVIFRAIATNNLVDSQGNPGNGYQTDTIFRKRFLGYEAVSLQIDTVIPNNSHLPYVMLEVVSPTNVRWDSIRWTATVAYNDSANIRHQAAVLPSVSAYTQTLQEPTPFSPNIQGASVVVAPSLTMPNTANGKVTMVVKGSDRTWARKEYTISQGTLSGPVMPLVLNAPNTGPAWVEYYWPDTLSIQASVSCSASVQVNGVFVTPSVTPGFYARRADTSMGQMYRGWGGFVYNAASGRHSQPINESLLCTPEVQTGDTLSLSQLAFIPLSVSSDSLGRLSWVGQGENVFLTDSCMSTARLGEQDISWSNPLSTNYDSSVSGSGDYRGTGASAPVLVSSSSGITGQEGADILGANFTHSYSDATTKGDVTFLDMNGDGYPDILADGTIQYTNTLGGLSGEIRYDVQKPTSKAQSDAWGTGGSPVNAASTVAPVVRGGKASAAGRMAAQLAKISISGNNAVNNDRAGVEYMDINGDGLSDMVCLKEEGSIEVRLNLGYSFSQWVSIGMGSVRKGVSISSNKSISGGDEYDFGGIINSTVIDKASSSFSAGVGISNTITREYTTLLDINGDGLPDKVSERGGGLWVQQNLGDHFSSISTVWASVNGINVSTTSGESANAAFTVAVNVPLIGAKFCVNPGAGIGRALTRTRMTVQDVDGDGFPDVVSSDSEAEVSVRRSVIGRTNMLRSVTNSLGGMFTIGYGHTTPTYGLPGGKWVMDTLEVDRGIHFTDYDIPVTRTAFSYSGGKRDRREREFLGFAEVVSTDLDTKRENDPYRSVGNTYDVTSIYRRGLPLASTLYDADGRMFTKTTNTYYNYAVRPSASNTLTHTLNSIVPPSDIWPVAYTPVRFTQNANYEGGTTAVKSLHGYSYYTTGCGELRYRYYDGKGVMLPTNFRNYDFYIGYEYSSVDGNNNGQQRTISRPVSEVVSGRNSALFHETYAEYATGRNAGRVASITRYYDWDFTDTTIVRYAYNEVNGNLKSSTQMSESGILRHTYKYDDDFLGIYPYRLIDSHDLNTDIESMDLRYGIATRVKDPNNSHFRTIYDGLGRLESVKSPNEEDQFPSTIDMRYTPMAVMRSDGNGIQTPAHAVTTYHLRRAYDNESGSNPQNDSMRVVVFVDGFGQVLQTRRESVVDNGTGTQQPLVVVEGGQGYDGLGRPIRKYYPTQAQQGTLMTYVPGAQISAHYTRTGYDVADRPTCVEQPDSAETRYYYDIADGCGRTTVIDPLGYRSETYANAMGNTVKTVMNRDAEATQPIVTRYLYDPIGRLTTVINAGGDSTVIEYDMLDRRTMVRHPASGTTRWTYDKLGNVLTEVNETLGTQGTNIRYTWDVDRLTAMVSPDDSVSYHYGGVNDLEKGVGRLRFRLNRSGGTEYGYDGMGNVTYEKNTVVVPGKGHATFETGWKYDSYGKLLSMTYPGDEKVVYEYNKTGDLYKVYRGRSGNSVDYVTSVGYDRFGDHVRIAYGNGTDMRYSYNERNRRLTSLTSYSGGTLRAGKNYLYDKDGNVVSMTGTMPVNYSYHYTYDPLNRLVAATQRYGNGNVIATDTLTMAYDDLWRVTSKSQRLSQTGLMFPGTLSTGYDMSYHYNPSWGRHFQMSDVTETHYRKEGIPTATDNVLSTHRYTYDPNGNLSYETVDRKRVDRNTTPDISERHLLWDCQNRLRGISDNGYVSLYWYDAEGNRTVKEHLGGKAIWVNAVAAGLSTDTVTYSIYPNPYITINGNRWTKHYYIGSERVASRTGTISGGFNGLHDMDSDVAGSTLQIPVNYDSMCATEEDSIASMYGRFGVPYEVQHANSRGQIAHMYFPITRADSGENTAGTSGDGSQRSHPNTLGEGPVYFYHRDHLGSTMSVTDSLDNTIQQVEYTPWGEVFVEQRSGNSDFSTPYLFNGKELDEETGLYYYGARYYDPKLSVWYSIDPMQMNYPWVSTYGYCLGNPINAIDSYGTDVIWSMGKGPYTNIIKALNKTKTYNIIFHRFIINQDNVTISSTSCNYFGGAPNVRNNNGYNIYIGHNGFVNNGNLTADPTFIAKVIMHEGLHCKYHLITNEGNLSFYPTLYENMKIEQLYENYHGQHNTMAEGNIQTFVQGMREFDNFYRTHHSDDWYNAMAWWGSLSSYTAAWWKLDDRIRKKYELIQNNELKYMNYLEAKAAYIRHNSPKNKNAMIKAKNTVDWELFKKTRNE